MIEQINQAILELRPEAKFIFKTVDPYNYPIDCLIWLDESSKPTWEEIEAELEDKDAVNEFLLKFVRERRLIELTAWKDSHEGKAVEVTQDSNTFSFKRDKLFIIEDRIFALEQDNAQSTGDWTTSDNKRVEMIKDEFTTLYKLAKLHLNARDQNIYNIYTEYKNQINSGSFESIKNLMDQLHGY